MNDLIVALVKVIHVCSAGFWFGAGLYLYMLTKADLAGDFTLVARYRAMIARVSKLGIVMPITSALTTGAGILLYLVAGYQARGFGSFGSIIFHIGVLAGIAATAHGATSFGRSIMKLDSMTAIAVAADGTVNAAKVEELRASQVGMENQFNIHLGLVVAAFVCMTFGASIA